MRIRQTGRIISKLILGLLFILLVVILKFILKSRDITLPTRIRLIKATVFPVVTYGCESWTIKKAEHQRIDAWVEVLQPDLFKCFPLDIFHLIPLLAINGHPVFSLEVV